MVQRTYRVAVRGELTGLTEEQRASLRAELDAHSLFASAYTPEGTLAYDAELRPFTVRVLVVEDGPDAAACDAAALATGTTAAELLLAERGLEGARLRATATSVDDVTARLRR